MGGALYIKPREILGEDPQKSGPSELAGEKLTADFVTTHPKFIEFEKRICCLLTPDLQRVAAFLQNAERASAQNAVTQQQSKKRRGGFGFVADSEKSTGFSSASGFSAKSGFSSPGDKREPDEVPECLAKLFGLKKDDRSNEYAPDYEVLKSLLYGLAMIRGRGVDKPNHVAELLVLLYYVMQWDQVGRT